MYDSVTSQYYLRARFYNPVIGRFLQEDSYLGDGLNLFSYCKNNPLMYYDPSGNLDKALGQWFTTEPPESVAKVRIDTAVKTHWIDSKTGGYEASSYIDNVYVIKNTKRYYCLYRTSWNICGRL